MSVMWLLTLLLTLSSTLRGKSCEVCLSLVWLHVREGLLPCAIVS